MASTDAKYNNESIELTGSNENKPIAAVHDESPAPQQLKRSLEARHLQMLAIASSIGTGLFIGSGKALRTGGPFSLIFSFSWLGAVLTTMMRM